MDIATGLRQAGRYIQGRSKVVNKIQIPTRIPEKIVVALFSGILVNSGILVDYTVVLLEL